MDKEADIHRLGFLVTDGARLLRAAFERRIADAGLGITPAEARTLLNIHALKDCRQLDIAARMGIEPMTVCAFLDKLQALGLIERQPDPADRRAKRVTLTPSCAPLILAIRKELDSVILKATTGMGSDEALLLCRLLERMNASFQGETAPLPETPECP
ncbi:DNA-binding MarR family transcriptional regulator [Neorhizobium galegae]|uniref:MarR family winged helix-turn-helix transcriptional regulator n=1 Tax=Neorhizobium galegae TaxID=399 RepID=UPI001AEB245D|nr:MarR family winged helix-turn-helix transcriptional regulator [Neorhizobium galegae]MBP2550342.1 DNA-binding MarR family transcriptional regulator [Neorhizobium galegae]